MLHLATRMHDACFGPVDASVSRWHSYAMRTFRTDVVYPAPEPGPTAFQRGEAKARLDAMMAPIYAAAVQAAVAAQREDVAVEESDDLEAMHARLRARLDSHFKR